MPRAQSSRRLFLQKLRVTFRKRMHERDFCIGEEEVETLFRELLGEPKPIKQPLIPTGVKNVNVGVQIAQAWEDMLKKSPVWTE